MILSSRFLSPNQMGVPTAPKVTGTVFRIRATKTAARGGKPRLKSRGAAMAAGVPNPAAPSKKAAKPKPCRVDARIRGTSIFQTAAARIAAASQARGMARVAGRRKPTMRTKASRMGMKAIMRNNPPDIKFLLQ